MDTWQEPRTLATYILVVLVFVFILITAIIIAVRLSLNKAIEAKEKESKLKLVHQQKLLENSIIIQERERARIAADIHDELIGKLTAIKMINQIQENSSEIDTLISSGIHLARRISHDLMPPLIEFSSLDELISVTAEPWQGKFELRITSNVDATVPVTPDIKIHFVRIVQEILVNIAKHSKANQVDIHLRITPKWVGMKIGDNGVGFNMKTTKHGLGLSNIETRIQHLKGKYKLKSMPNKGTYYTFITPTVFKEHGAESKK